MLLKFGFAFCLFIATANVESFTATTLLNLIECASPIPCIKTPTVKTSTTSTTTTTTTKTPPTSNKKACKNCPLPDCSMASNGTTFPYANHCKLFYQCIDAVAEICVCPNGYWYDRENSKCLLCDLVSNCVANKD